jgi:glycosyltransferase involved in cell wall biosynthesis
MARTVRNSLTLQGFRIPEIEVIPLGISEWFLSPKRPLARPASAPYFICVGTIEPRKNLQFLLAIWRRLAETLGSSAPKLIIAGRRGWENENVLDILERSRVLAPFVAEVADLSDAGLASLIAGATALVAPSFAEGFGLPVAESLAVGTPVLASDISAHREVGGDFATYLDPIDGRAWHHSILQLLDPKIANAGAREQLQDFRPMTWETHVAMAIEVISRISQPK